MGSRLGWITSWIVIIVASSSRLIGSVNPLTHDPLRAIAGAGVFYCVGLKSLGSACSGFRFYEGKVRGVDRPVDYHVGAEI